MDASNLPNPCALKLTLRIGHTLDADPPLTLLKKGPNHPNTGYLGEASLDVEYISTVGYGVRTIVWSVAGSGFDLLSWALNVSGSDDPGTH